ncbi:MAG TPA: type II CAAX endopeptidase family protein, partial [Gemmatimonadaceae bacterium]|nr:type II CAAX endopeptidase family protein [Gemmatimonadaceae bacterium]
RPAIPEDSARALAAHVLASWLGEPPDRWRTITSSYETRKTSGRIDRTVTFERTDRRVGDAPIRLDVVIAGDMPAEARMHLVVPESFRRRYDEMRSANDQLALLASAGILVIVLAGAGTARATTRQAPRRWPPAMVAGGVIGALVTAAFLNELPASWYGYDTATSPAVFQGTLVATAMLAGLATAVLVALTLGIAESLTRLAFPDHPDWWKLWRHRGTRDVAYHVAGGYATAAFAFAYVALFYVITRELFGWWVPSALLDNPNQIATPMPWIAGIALSLQAAVWEEALFRAIPLSALSLWVRHRPGRVWWMSAGVIATALIFGFAHANYPSWPPYSRGVEIFLDAALWGVLFLRFGLLVTVIAHFVYDMVLFGLFAAAGSAMPYRVTAAVTLLVLLAPALAVAWRWIRQRRLPPLPADARFGAWAPAPRSTPVVLEPVQAARALPAGRATIAVAVAALLAVVIRPESPVLGPNYTATRDRARQTADSALRARGADPGAWTVIATTATDTLGTWRQFLRQNDSAHLARRLADSYMIPTWWILRYVRTADSLAQRAEEWRIRVLPDGRLLDVRHLVPESAPGETPGPDEARRIALETLRAERVNTTPLVETRYDETARPARRDVTVTYTDTSVHLPQGARARVWVSLAGREVVSLRRGVELPEEVLRQQRRREQGVAAFLGGGGLIALTLVGFAAVATVRRRPVLLHDGLARGTAVSLAVLLGVFLIAESIQDLPRVLLGYDTSVPWDRFLGRTSLGIGLSLVGVFLVVALWLLLNALRRRVGIPLVARNPDATAGNETVLTGLGLGSALVLIQQVGAWGVEPAIPAAPSTLLDQIAPVFAHGVSLGAGSAISVPVLAIPLLAVLGGLSRRSRTLLLALVALALLAFVASPAGDRLRESGAAGLGVALGAPVALFFALRRWGGVSVASWVVAALVVHALDALRLVRHAPTLIERGAGVVSLALTGLLTWWLVARVRGLREHQLPVEAQTPVEPAATTV